MQIVVTMCRDWIAPPDARGDALSYAKGWYGEMEDDLAAFCISTGYATAAHALPHEVSAAVALLREVVEHFRTVERVEPTYFDVYGAVARLEQSWAGDA